MRTKFGADSSNCFLFRAQTNQQTNRQTDRRDWTPYSRQRLYSRHG